MSDIRTTLERIERRVSMPEPAMERMLRRRERKERNERIAASVVGLGVAVAGIAGAFLTLRVAGGPGPASGGGEVSAATEGGSLVLPAIAIWTALAVLAVTALAVVRHRARPATVDVDVDREGREPGGAAASARRPAAAPGGALREGGSEMDSKHKAEVVGLPRTEMPEIRFDDGKLRRTNRWLIGAVVVLAVAVVALGVGLIVQAGSEEPAPAPKTVPTALADPAVTALVDGFLAAHNANDADRVAQEFVTDAVFTSVDPEGRYTPYEGRDAIWSMYNELFATIPDLRVERVSPILQSGDVTSFTLRDSNQTEMMWVLVWRDGKIAEQWNVFHDDHPVKSD